MAYTNFTPAAYGQFIASAVMGNVALPGGGGATLLVTNAGPAAAYVALGASTVTVSATTGVLILPGFSLPLAVGSTTNIAAIAAPGLGGGGAFANLNLVQGT